MATNKHVSPYPHPAFPDVLLPDSVKTKLKRNNKPHYPQEYLDSLEPYDSVPEQVDTSPIASCGSANSAWELLSWACMPHANIRG